MCNSICCASYFITSKSNNAIILVEAHGLSIYTPAAPTVDTEQGLAAMQTSSFTSACEVAVL